MLGFQISKEGRKFGQIYVGLQNALNVRQLDPVLGGDLPFEDRFDASIVWGPIMGRNFMQDGVMTYSLNNKKGAPLGRPFCFKF